MAPSDANVELDEKREIAPDEIVSVRILSVPESDKFPEGVKYGFNYTKKGADDPILRYDNHHGVHEIHEGDSTTELDDDEFPGVRAHLRDFLDETGIDL